MLHTLLEYKIQLTTYLLPRELLSDVSRSVCYVSQRNPLTIYIAYELLGATLRTNTLPFLILVDKLVLLGSQHHLLLFTHPGSLAGQSIRILSLTLALHIHPPVLSVNAASRL